jgi:putative peptidoglycan lipid II flippase
MLPALLGVSVAQISLLINTQIASYLRAGQRQLAQQRGPADGVPDRHAGRGAGRGADAAAGRGPRRRRPERYSAMLDWGLRLVVLLADPEFGGAAGVRAPLVATLFHYGAFKDSDVGQVASALAGYGTRPAGLVAIKVLAPGYYASHDMKTPMRIAIVALVITQLLNSRWCRAASMRAWRCRSAWARWSTPAACWSGCCARQLQAAPGWGMFALQVLPATRCWRVPDVGAHSFPWIAGAREPWQRSA